MTELDPRVAETIAEIVLDAIDREYPNKIAHTLSSDEDVAPPRALTPAFFGAYDWHSSVHGHWTLARLCRLFPDAAFVARARAALGTSLCADKLAGELRYLDRPDRSSFEVPYGMGWLLTLDLELHEWQDAEARAWRAPLAPLVALAASRLERHFARLPHPVRTGEHSQTAFGAALYLDWARGTGEAARATDTEQRLLALYVDDRDGPLHLEPSGHDFLSPCLAEADLMRRLLAPEPFGAWLTRFLPTVPHEPDPIWLAPPRCPDSSDPKLVHLDGLSASRAWMLEGIARGLPPSDARRLALLEAARAHRAVALAALRPEHYAGSHWLGTFAVYLASGRAR